MMLQRRARLLSVTSAHVGSVVASDQNAKHVNDRQAVAGISSDTTVECRETLQPVIIRMKLI